MDWNKYRKNFPERYWKAGHFDNYVINFLENKKISEVLDFGGGRFGTEVLNRPELTVYFHDPFVEKPEWQKNPSENQKFQAIVARGCINYLTLEEISKLKDKMQSGGYLIFNSFEKKPEPYEKTFIDQKGEICLEKAYCEGKVVHHFIEKHEERIVHKFFHYTLDEYEKALGQIKVERYGKNSVIIVFKNS